MIKFGIVTEQSASTGKVRVSLLGENMATQLLPVVFPGAGVDKYFSLPGIGDQVACLMDEFCEDGVVLGSIYSSEDNPPSGASSNVSMVRFSDGTIVKYDKDNATITVDAVSKVIIKSPDNEIQGPLKVTGKITGQSGAEITGNVEASGQVTALAGTPTLVNLSTHVHISAAPGSPTAPPTPGT